MAIRERRNVAGDELARVPKQLTVLVWYDPSEKMFLGLVRELSIYTQARTFMDAVDQLREQSLTYVQDALASEHQADLLPRYVSRTEWWRLLAHLFARRTLARLLHRGRNSVPSFERRTLPCHA